MSPVSKSSEHTSSILIFAEDPGALNGLLSMARRLASAGHKIYIELDGYASSAEGLDLHGFTSETGSLENISTKKYDAILVGTSENINSTAFDLIEKCKNFGVRTFAFIDSPANPSKRFSAGGNIPLKFAPDFLIVLDQQTAMAFEDLGFSHEAILVIDHPHIEYLHRQRTKFSGQAAADIRSVTFGEIYRNKIVVTFCSELSSGLDDGGYERNSSYLLYAPECLTNRSDVVVHNFLKAVDQLKDEGVPVKSVLRLHPKQTVEDIILNDHFDFISQGGDPVKACMASSIVVGMTSMILVEAFELGIPVISLLPRIEEIEWMHVSIRNKIPIHCNYNEFLAEIRKVLDAGDLDKYPRIQTKYDYASNAYVDFIGIGIKY